MSDVTDADRAKALEIIPRHRGLCDFDWHTGPNGRGCSCGADSERVAIAKALAAEREAAYDDGYAEGNRDGMAAGMGDV